MTSTNGTRAQRADRGEIPARAIRHTHHAIRDRNEGDRSWQSA